MRSAITSRTRSQSGTSPNQRTPVITIRLVGWSMCSQATSAFDMRCESGHGCGSRSPATISGTVRKR